MAKQTFTTGQVLTAAQMTSLQQTAMGGGSPSTKTASYVLTAADAGTVIQMNSASATTITVNTSLFAAGDSVQIQNIGAGVCTITAGTATVNSAGTLGVTQYDGGFLYFSSASSAIWFDYTQAGTTLPLTTKGDLFGYDTGNARIPVGANDTVLTADSTQALGVKWATPAAGGGANWTLLNAGGTALTGAATITVSGISGADKVFVLVSNASSATAGSEFNIRFNGDSASNYFYVGALITANASPLIPANLTRAASTNTQIRFGTLSSAASSDIAGYVSLTGGNSSGIKMIQSVAAAAPAGADSQEHYYLGGYYNSSSTISSVSIRSTAGNFDAGTIYVYTSA